jgi:hypothetical protein
MKKFHSINIDAGELVRNLGRLGELRSQAQPIEITNFGLSLSQKEVRAIWEDSRKLSTDLPSILLTTEANLSQILPRLLALPSAVTPVTSLMNVWLIEDFQYHSRLSVTPLSDAAASGFIGLIIGELLATIGSDADLRVMGMDSVRRTLSFACAKAVEKGWRNEAFTTLAKRWSEASILTSNEVNNLTIRYIAYISEFLSAISDRGCLEGSIAESLAYQVHSWVKESDTPDQPDLLNHSLVEVAISLTGVRSREKRYDLVTEALEQIYSNNIRNPLKEGFLISLIEPGSYEFLELARRSDRSGSVAIAYCACAAILDKESALRKFNGFGWNILNQGFRADADIPFDISIAELRILYDGRRSTPIAFRTRSPWLIDVELLPMVSASFGNLSKLKSTSQKSHEAAQTSAREELISERVMTAMRALEEAHRVLQGKQPSQDAGGPRKSRGIRK